MGILKDIGGFLKNMNLNGEVNDKIVSDKVISKEEDKNKETKTKKNGKKIKNKIVGDKVISKDETKDKKIEIKRDKNGLIQLNVSKALKDDTFKGIARIDTNLMKELKIQIGDTIKIKGNGETFAIVDRSSPADVGEGIIRIDRIQRKNARIEIGEVVSISKAEIKEAKKIIIAPVQKGIMVQGDPQGLRNGLLGRTVIKGDIVALSAVQRRKDLFSEMGMDDEMGGLLGDMFGDMGFGNLEGGIAQIKFLVISVMPNQPVKITENTEVCLNPKAIEIAENIYSKKDVNLIVDRIKNDGARFVALQDGCNNFIKVYKKYEDIKQEYCKRTDCTIYQLKPVALVKGARLEHKKIKNITKKDKVISPNIKISNSPRYLILQNGCNNFISLAYNYETAVKIIPGFNQTNTVYEMKPYSRIELTPQVVKI